LRHSGLGVLEPVIAVGLVLAAVRGLLDWLTGPLTGLLDIGRERGYLPPFFRKVNSSGVQVRILVTQGMSSR
jgi:glutamate:GABA antiporter